MNTAGTKNAKQHSRGLIVLVAMIAVGGLGIVARVRSEAALEGEARDVETPLVKTVHAVRGGVGGELTLPGEVRAYVDAGCTCPILYPLGPDVQAMLDAFSDGI